MLLRNRFIGALLLALSVNSMGCAYHWDTRTEGLSKLVNEDSKRTLRLMLADSTKCRVRADLVQDDTLWVSRYGPTEEKRGIPLDSILQIQTRHSGLVHSSSEVQVVMLGLLIVTVLVFSHPFSEAELNY